MKILLAHSRHGSTAPSGENVVFDTEVNLLRSRGHYVRTFERDVDALHARGWRGQLEGALTLAWNPVVAKALREEAQRWRPDVVHVHNTFPMLSSAIFPALAGLTARVWTLHNFRIFCAGGIPMRDGAVCVDCMKTQSVTPALKHGCYRGSIVATAPVAMGISLNRRRGTWTRHVEAYIALSEFARGIFEQAGLPASRLHVKPNFFPGNPSVVPWEDRRGGVVFVGRVGREKGVSTLVDAWRIWGGSAPELQIVGDGQLRASLEARAPRNVKFRGLVTAETAQDVIAHARLLVLPSECWEGFPMVIREAFALGTPCAVSDLGPLPSLVGGSSPAGVLFRPGDAHAMASVLRAAWEEPRQLQTMSIAARDRFVRLYSEQANYEQLMNVYRAAVAAREPAPT